MCLNFCLNKGRCVSTQEGSVSCICPHGLGGSRCERKIGPPPETDSDEIKSTLVTVLSTIGLIVGLILLGFGLFYFWKKTRLGSAFKHRRMAENLLSNNIEFSNQMFMPEEDESDIIIMREATNFSNPVYESMYNNQQNEALLHEQQQENQEERDPESIDLLTEN